MKIENSTRLSYQLIDESDSEFLFQLDQDPEVMRYINGGKMTTQKDIDNKFIPRLNTYKNAEKGWGLWKVTIIESNEDIGWILVRPMDFFSDTPLFNVIELGWRFFKASWGRGYATEASRQVLSVLSQNTEHEFFGAIALPENKASIDVMKKLGMVYVKTYTHQSVEHNDVDAVVYCMKNPVDSQSSQ